MPTITAAITTYKRNASVIERALQSIEDQTYPIHEVLLVDDNVAGSPFTREIKQMLQRHPQVQYLSRGSNYGVASARNLALDNATGEYISFLDDDDEWALDKIEKQVAVLKEHPAAGLVFCTGIKLNEDTDETEATWNLSIYKDHPSYEDLLAHDYTYGVFALYRMSALTNGDRVIRYRKMPAVEDYEFSLQVAKHSPVYGTPKALYVYHVHTGDRVSVRHENTFEGYRQIYLLHKEDYDRCVHAKRWIMYNIMREGIKARKLQVIPYCFQWLGCLLCDIFKLERT